jgi:hypothetical protein
MAFAFAMCIFLVQLLVTSKHHTRPGPLKKVLSKSKSRVLVRCHVLIMKKAAAKVKFAKDKSKNLSQKRFSLKAVIPASKARRESF